MLRYVMMLFLGSCLVIPGSFESSGSAMAAAQGQPVTSHEQAQEMRRSSGSKGSRRTKSVKTRQTVVKSRSTSVTFVDRSVNQRINSTNNTTVINPAATSAPVAAASVAASNTALPTSRRKRPVCPADLDHYGTIKSGAKTINICRSPQGICTLARTTVTVDCSAVNPLSY